MVATTWALPVSLGGRYLLNVLEVRPVGAPVGCDPPEYGSAPVATDSASAVPVGSVPVGQLCPRFLAVYSSLGRVRKPLLRLPPLASYRTHLGTPRLPWTRLLGFGLPDVEVGRASIWLLGSRSRVAVTRVSALPDLAGSIVMCGRVVPR